MKIVVYLDREYRSSGEFCLPDGTETEGVHRQAVTDEVNNRFASWYSYDIWDNEKCI